MSLSLGLADKSAGILCLLSLSSSLCNTVQCRSGREGKVFCVVFVRGF